MARSRGPSSRSSSYANCATASHRQMGPPAPVPPHPPSGPSNANRRRSDYMRSLRTPQPHEIPNNGVRRASEPIAKTSEVNFISLNCAGCR